MRAALWGDGGGDPGRSGVSSARLNGCGPAAATGREIKVLVNNAGLGCGRGASPTATDWAREYASVMVNVVAATVLMKEAVTAMAEAGPAGVS